MGRLNATIIVLMPELIWTCPNCGGSNERMDAVKGRRKFWLFGKRNPKLVATCLDCWAEMRFVGVC